MFNIFSINKFSLMNRVEVGSVVKKFSGHVWKIIQTHHLTVIISAIIFAAAFFISQHLFKVFKKQVKSTSQPLAPEIFPQALHLSPPPLALPPPSHAPAPPLTMPIFQKGEEIPEDFLCPITCDIMRDPVIVGDGRSYERKAIQQWYNQGKRTCPMNPSAVLTNPKEIGSDRLLKRMIKAYLKAQKDS